ncbi:MAG TPA: patatin-like phospholipase family protein [Bacteroidales bacterium]|nr:patatin-like phospholipase family protein [Bacteroidales bacterium]HPS61706.1 patatin-like phospholipase family protein [Bacteroidales bacterium]
MRNIWKWFVFLCFVQGSLLIPYYSQAQRVALVLSGGASKGGAHVGVLRALEEQHVPVDYIVGTSIGAVVGALYASGYSPDEIGKIMASNEFQRWVTGGLDSKYVYYYRKGDPNASWISTSFDFNRKLTSMLPTQLIRTFEIDFRLMEMLSQSNAVAHENFDSLFVPFRCVVADIDTTAQLVLRKGDLSSAVRASMSLPLIFTPITVGGKLVYDGGMYNNFPCDVARQEFHPDVIIGSRVAQRYEKPDREDLVSQLLTMLMERQSDTLAYPNSVMIVPNIPTVNLLDFSLTPRLADSGYSATLRKIPEIRRLVHDSVDGRAMGLKRSRFNNRKPALRFDSIHIAGLTKPQAGYTRRILKHSRKTIGLEDLRPEYFRFIDEGYIKTIFPNARYNPRTGFFDLDLDVTKTNRFGVQFGGNFSLGNQSEAFLELQYKYLWSKALRFFANGYVGKVYSSARFGGRIDFNSRLPWFFEINYTYNHLNYFRNSSFFFDDKLPNYIIESEYFGDISAGVPITNNGKLSLGMVYAFTNDKYYQGNIFSRTDTTDQTSFDFYSPSLTFDLNSLNRKQYPSAGIRLLVRLSYINGMEQMQPGSTALVRKEVKKHHDWFKVKLMYDNYFESVGPVKFGLYLEGVLSNQPIFSNYLSTSLYASPFQPDPESQIFFLPAFRSTNYAAAGLKAVLRIYKQVEYRLEGYLFQPYREIMRDPADLTATFGPKFSDRSYMATTALVYNSPLGPVSIGVNYYDKMPGPFSVTFNFGYFLFNRRAMP